MGACEIGSIPGQVCKKGVRPGLKLTPECAKSKTGTKSGNSMPKLPPKRKSGTKSGNSMPKVPTKSESEGDAEDQILKTMVARDHVKEGPTTSVVGGMKRSGSLKN